MDALILAGGLGTRLRAVVSDRAKSVADVLGRPFLCHVLDRLQAFADVRRVVLCVGHHADSVVAALGHHHGRLPLVYSRESEPLGTGGAIRRAVQSCDINAPFLALNGDTVLGLQYPRLKHMHQVSRADLTLALVHVRDAGRFGTVRTRDGRIVQFNERGAAGGGWINGGVYVFGTRATNALMGMPHKFSLEADFFPSVVQRLKLSGYRSRGRFLDIGVPEDYSRAAALLGGDRNN